MPLGGVSVARPGRYGNPFVIEKIGSVWTVSVRPCTAGVLTEVQGGLAFVSQPGPGRAEFVDKEGACRFAVGQHRAHLLNPHDPVVPITVAEVRAELEGRDLGCWCALSDLWCHADTLLVAARGGFDTEP